MMSIRNLPLLLVRFSRVPTPTTGDTINPLHWSTMSSDANGRRLAVRSLKSSIQDTPIILLAGVMTPTWLFPSVEQALMFLVIRATDACTTHPHNVGADFHNHLHHLLSVVGTKWPCWSSKSTDQHVGSDSVVCHTQSCVRWTSGCWQN